MANLCQARDIKVGDIVSFTYRHNDQDHTVTVADIETYVNDNSMDLCYITTTDGESHIVEGRKTVAIVS